MPQRTVDINTVNNFLAQQQGPAPMNVVRDVAPAQPMPEGFTANLLHEGAQGGQQIMSGMSSAAGAPGTVGGIGQAMVGVGQAALGGLQAVNAPVTAAARQAGQWTQDAVQPVAGEMAGAVAGTVVDTATQVLGGAALGRVARATAQGLSMIAPGFYGPSSVIRRTMQAEEASDLASLIKPSGVDADEIYNTLDTVTQTVPMPNLYAFTKRLTTKETNVKGVAGKTLQSPPLRAMAQDIRTNIEDVGPLKNEGGELAFNKLKDAMTRFNERIRDAPESRKEELYGAYKKLMGKIKDDLENTRILYRDPVTGTLKDAYTELLRANDAWRLKSAAEDFQTFITKGMGRSPRGDLTFDAPSVLKKIDRNEYFRESIPSDTLKEITTTLGTISRRTPAQHTPVSDRVGLTAGIIGGAALANQFAGVGPSLTAPATMGMTGAAGLLLGADVLISKAMMTKSGQMVLRRLFSKDAFVTPEKMDVLKGVVSEGVRQTTDAANALSRPKETVVQVPAQ